MRFSEKRDYTHVSYYISGELQEYVLGMSKNFGLEPNVILRWFSVLGMRYFKEIRKKHRMNENGNKALKSFVYQLRRELWS